VLAKFGLPQEKQFRWRGGAARAPEES